METRRRAAGPRGQTSARCPSSLPTAFARVEVDTGAPSGAKKVSKWRTNARARLRCAEVETRLKGEEKDSVCGVVEARWRSCSARLRL